MKEEENTGRAPRNQRTPMGVASGAFSVARNTWVGMSAFMPNATLAYDERDSYFMTEIFRKALRDPETNGKKCEEQIPLRLDGLSGLDADAAHLAATLITVVAYVVESMRANNDDRHEEAWSHAADAQFWIGVASAMFAATLCPEKRNPAAEMAKLRHAEDYALSADAIKFWRENIDQSLSAQRAANELLKVVPLGHKKLAELVSAARNKAGLVSSSKKKKPR